MTEQSNMVAFEPLLSAKDAAKLLGIHPVTLLRWARENKVPHHRLGRKVTFRTSELNNWYMTLYNDGAVRVAPTPKGVGA
jgi:excisionase family DNA binding protein